MAFVSRAERELQLGVGWKNDMGPGAYLNTVDKQKVKGAAVFSETAARSDMTTSNAPGPGAYSTPQVQIHDTD
jgi:hypothetical protein